MLLLLFVSIGHSDYLSFFLNIYQKINLCIYLFYFRYLLYLDTLPLLYLLWFMKSEATEIRLVSGKGKDEKMQLSQIIFIILFFQLELLVLKKRNRQMIKELAITGSDVALETTFHTLSLRRAFWFRFRQTQHSPYWGLIVWLSSITSWLWIKNCSEM